MAFDGLEQEYKRETEKKYGNVKGKLHLVEIARNDSLGLGLSLVGNKDLTTMSIFVNALKEGYPAANSHQIFVGDELLEVNGQSLQGRSHLNVTPLFNSTTTKNTKILILRSKDFLDHIAVSPRQFQPRSDELTEDSYGQSRDTDKDAGARFEFKQTKTNILQKRTQNNASRVDVENDPDDEVFCNSHDASNCSALSKSSSETFSARSQYKFCEDLHTCPVISGRITKIEIKKGKLPMGCRIVGGIDKSLRRILVFEIYDGGAAARDGRLKVGDEILEVNGQTAHSLTHAEVVMQLRRSSSSLELLLARDIVTTSDSNEISHIYLKEKFFNCKEFVLEIVKMPGRSFGFSVIPVWRDRGVLVVDVMRGSRTEELGSVFCGDEIVSVNGIRLEHLTTKEALLTIKTIIGKIFMEIHRADVGLVSSPYNSSDFLPNSSSSPFYSDPVIEMKKPKNSLKCKLPSCFSNGKK